jgi:NAD(P)-dependent dehydrogenase (short-subunit alcohol dehydrogenase family)
MNLELQGRVALVTGGSRGIGRATAEALAKEGARVAISYLKNREKAEAIVGEIVASGGEMFAVNLDLGSIASIRSAVESVAQKWGKLDILVNNAVEWGPVAGPASGLFEHLTPEEWQYPMRTNAEGTFATIQLAVPMMRRQKWGRIVNVSAVLAEDGLAGYGWYSMAKASLHGLTRTLSKELGPAGILVNCVMPGLTLTDRVQTMRAGSRTLVARSTPIRRMLQPCDVANPIVYLCSGANESITGEVLRVSGGRM